MKRKTYRRFFRKWIKSPKARVLFVPDSYFVMCLQIMQRESCYSVGIVKKSDEEKYWAAYFSCNDDLSDDY